MAAGVVPERRHGEVNRSGCQPHAPYTTEKGRDGELLGCHGLGFLVTVEPRTIPSRDPSRRRRGTGTRRRFGIAAMRLSLLQCQHFEDGVLSRSLEIVPDDFIHHLTLS